MTKEELEKEAEEYALKQWEGNLPWSVIQKSYFDGALPREKRIAELEELIEKYRQAVDKCLHITFMGAGCEVNTIGQYATLVDGYLTDVEGLAKWKN